VTKSNKDLCRQVSTEAKSAVTPSEWLRLVNGSAAIMGVNHILGWYYGKLTFNRIWAHSSALVSRFGAGNRKIALGNTGRMGFKVRTYKGGRETSRVEYRNLSKAIPAAEHDKDLSM